MFMHVIILIPIAVTMCKRADALGSSIVNSKTDVKLQTLCDNVYRTFLSDLRQTVYAYVDILCGNTK